MTCKVESYNIPNFLYLSQLNLGPHTRPNSFLSHFPLPIYTFLVFDNKHKKLNFGDPPPSTCFWVEAADTKDITSMWLFYADDIEINGDKTFYRPYMF